LLRLTTSDPGHTEYLAALADNHNQIGLIDWSLNRPIAAEPAWRQAWEIFTELSEVHRDEPRYQAGVAMMLANLGSICYFTDRFEEAEEYYRRAETIREHLPDAMKDSATGLASQAGSCTNQAELARLRGEYDRALELLAESIPLHQESLAKWPTNPVALDCYFHTLWNIGECQLGEKNHAAAAAAVERLVETFPNRLDAYHQGAVQLLRCAALASSPPPPSAGEPASSPPPPSAGEGLGEGANSAADTYRQRARELVAKAYDAPQRTPDTISHFAWFLLMCPDESFRDPPWALQLAKRAAKDVPDRAATWFTLALAHYRNGDWPAASDAVAKSIQLGRGDDLEAPSWLLHSMLRAQQGREDEARKLYEMADAWIAENKPNDRDLLSLATEAESTVAQATESSDVVNSNSKAN
jgi:tetratricopeptide (TPR) repeat protein